MRIIDSNKDYYDFYQNVYMDNTFTFDRRDSYNLSKEEFASNFYVDGIKFYHIEENKENCKHKYILLQICNTFWLFDLYITKYDSYGRCEDYELSLLHTWKNYNKDCKLIELTQVKFSWWADKLNNMLDLINFNNHKVLKVFNDFTLYRDNIIEKKHTPILQNIGIASLIPPLDIYLALEEYFSTIKTKSERRESIGLTDKEKIENHGFDLVTSFRGKNK